jgi:hypothetical protein
MHMRRIAVLIVPLVAALAALGHATAAHAAGPQLGIADDRVLIGGGPEAQDAVQRWAKLGVQEVRVTAMWNRIAPSPRSKSRPKGFNAADPNSPGYKWAPLDNALALLSAYGIKPILMVSGPGPYWGSQHPSHKSGTYYPSPSAFGSFATAVATRYGAQVDSYVIWNEPNLAAWLSPQNTCRKHHGCTPLAPSLYRNLVRAAYPAIHKADAKATVLIGAMSSRGSDPHSASSTERPLAFLRALGCVNSHYSRLRTGACKGFKPATGDGFAYHPHSVLLAPNRPFPNHDDADIASLGRVESTLDKLQRRGRLKATTHRFNLYIDEFGFQTNPPDKLAGVSLSQQDKWLQQAAYIAWRDPRVKLFSQYLWRDDPVQKGGGYGGWQSGLLYANGRAKPALKHFGDPFAMDTSRNRLWGQVRARNAPSVTVQRRLKGARAWTTVKTVHTDANGYWSWHTSLRKGASYRYLAAGATSSTLKRG